VTAVGDPVLAGAIPPGYPAGDSEIISLPNHIPVHFVPLLY